MSNPSDASEGPNVAVSTDRGHGRTKASAVDKLLHEFSGMRGRMSVRLRLTLVYGGLFFLAGVLLLIVTYVLVGQILQHIVVSPGNGTLLSPQEWRQLTDQLSQEYRARVLRSLLRQELIALVLVGICATIFGYLIADRALAPLQKVTATARKLSESTLHERIALRGPDDEIKELANTFDAMLARLQWAFDSQRRFVANASHELRTPLAINRTLLEVALADPEASADLKAVGRTLLATNARHERLIEGLLLLARSERGLTTRSSLDLAEITRNVCETYASDAKTAGIELSTELTSASMSGDPVLVERLVSNLVDNALRYNVPEGGSVWVRTLRAAGAAVCQVANTGPVIGAYEVDSLFEAFHRLPEREPSESGEQEHEGAGFERVGSERGAGLGLSIVRSMVQAHGGTVTAQPRAGGGLIFTVRLPTT